MTDQADAEIHGLVRVTDHLDHHVDHFPTGQLRHRLNRVHLGIANRRRGTVARTVIQPRRQQVDADDLPGTHVRQCQVEELPDRALADDGEIEIEDVGEFLQGK